MGKIMKYPKANYDEKLPVANLSFINSEYMSVNELFDGYDDLKVVTYSYELDFIEPFVNKFETMTVCLGCEDIVRGDVVPIILASQKLSVIGIRKHEELVARAMDGSVRFLVAKEITSHQKIYILTAKDGRTRVIFGSANFSRRAFSGLSEQGEVIAHIDNDENAYKYFLSMFEFLQDFCMDEVPLKSLYAEDSDDPAVGDLPISDKILTKNVGVIVEKPNGNPEEAEYVTDVSAIARQYAGEIQKASLRYNKAAKQAEILPNHIHLLMRTEKKEREEEAAKNQVFPRLHVDYDMERVTFNGKEYPTQNADYDSARADLIILEEYFHGFDSFIGDTEKSKQTYFKLMNFMLVSPFMAMLRYVAHNTGFAEEYFPYFAVLNGKKSAGKTQFVQTIQYLMTGEKIEPTPLTTLTRKEMYASLREVEGIPMCIDDVPRDYFIRNASAIVRCDEELFEAKLTYHGSYIITTNEIQTIKPEMAKRMYYASVQATQTNTDATAKKKKMSDLRSRLSISFYCAYLHEMLPLVNDMIYKMKTFDSEHEEWYPDIFKLSSETIMAIFEKCQLDVPDYMCALEYDDYFGYNNISGYIRSFIADEWRFNSSAFKENRKHNTLEYNAGEHGYEADRVCDSLPEILEAKRSGTKVIMKLNEAEKFFGINFKKRWHRQ